MNEPSKSLRYSDAGVDIDAGNELVNQIKPLARSTVRRGADSDLGGFGGLFDLAAVKFRDPILVSATDGVGTKLKLAIEHNCHNTVGIDLVAMCVNDLLCQGAEPLFFLDYFATGALDLAQATTVIAGIAEGCKQAHCALIGGETAEMPGMYRDGDYDLAGFAVGAVEREQIIDGSAIEPGDTLIGLPSNGFHSNGYSLVRHVLAQSGIDPATAQINDTPLLSAIMAPTTIYVRSVLPLFNAGLIRGCAHITGGGITENLPRVLPQGCAAEIDLNTWKRPPVFTWIQDQGGIADDEMLKTFNCGIGLVLVVGQDDQQAVLEALQTLYRSHRTSREISIGHGSRRSGNHGANGARAI